MQVTQDLILQGLKQLRTQSLSKQKLKDYYDGNHDILHNYRMENARSNRKIVVNYPKKFIEERVSYILSNPINYISTVNDTDLLSLIDLNFSYWEKLHNQELVRQSQIFGRSYEVQYINQDGEFKCSVLTPLNCWALESGDVEKNVQLAIHLYKNQFEEDEFIDVYTVGEIITYKLHKEDLIETKRRSHIFPGVPVTVCRANSQEKSLTDDIKTENDAFNEVLSDIVNEIGDHRSAYLKLINSKLEKEDADIMKESGIISVSGDKSDVDWLIKNINDQFIANTLENLEDKIYKLANSIDTNQKLQSNLSGVALRSRMIALEFACGLISNQLEFVIKQRINKFFYFLKIANGKKYDYRTIKIKTTANIPSDLVGLADVITKLRSVDVLSQKSAISLLPFIENVDIEVAQIKKEQDENSIDLDRIVGE